VSGADLPEPFFLLNTVPSGVPVPCTPTHPLSFQKLADLEKTFGPTSWKDVSSDLQEFEKPAECPKYTFLNYEECNYLPDTGAVEETPTTIFESNETDSNMIQLESLKPKPRKQYQCKKCGQPKRGHKCQA
jgi:hypothetical protein